MIEARQLTKQYGNKLVVDGIDFTVSPGRITGFLGPNGAGKTTTLRMILGLVHPTSGSVTLQDKPFHKLNQPLHHVGVVLDAQAFVRRRTGYQHLMCWAGLAGVGSARIRSLLKLVGLEDAADRPVGTYSLGMRQRLALATSLLGDPSVLILDEPANGLDPDGILWLRRTLTSLASEGRTVLLASHLLAEADLFVDDVLLIRDGRLLYCGPRIDLVAHVPHNSSRASDLESAYLFLTRQEE